MPNPSKSKKMVRNATTNEDRFKDERCDIRKNERGVNVVAEVNRFQCSRNLASSELSDELSILNKLWLLDKGVTDSHRASLPFTVSSLP